MTIYDRSPSLAAVNQVADSATTYINLHSANEVSIDPLLKLLHRVPAPSYMRPNAGTAQKLSVCARCRCRFLGQYYLPQIRTYKYSLRHYGEAAVARSEGRPTATEGRARLSSSTANTSNPFASTDQRKPYVFRHLNLNEENVALGVSALGKPARIRILKDKPKRKRVRLEKRQDDTQSHGSASAEDLLNSLEARQAQPHPSQVNAYVEAVRCSLDKEQGSQGPAVESCQRAAHRLQRGLNRQQIKEYTEDELKKQTLSRAGNLDCSHSGRGFRRTPWIVGSTDFETTPQDRFLYMSASKKMLMESSRSKPMGQEKPAILGIRRLLHPPIIATTEGSAKEISKALAVERLIRDVWHIRPQEERHVLGEVDFETSEEVLDVLLKNQTFKKIAKLYRVRISISKSASIVRLSTRYTTGSDATAALEQAMASVRCAKMRFGLMVDEQGGYEIQS